MNQITLVLLPGLDGSGVLFQPLLKHLPPQIWPLVVRYPPDRKLGYDELLALVLAVLPTDSHFVLLGESFSGPLSLMAAATCPPGLCGVILCATFIRNPVWSRPKWLRHFSRPLAFRFFPQMSRLKSMIFGYSTSELRQLSAEALGPVRPEVIAHRVRAVLEVDVRGQLCACRVPVLYLRGKRDLVVPTHNLAEIKAACPSIKVAELPAPHWVLQTQPKLAAEIVSSFVNEVARGSNSEQRA